MDTSTLQNVLEARLRGSLPGDALSHPDRLLVDHSIGTLRLACEAVKRHKLQNASNILYAAAFHDICKSDPKFQEHIRGMGHCHVPHSAPSAACAWSYIDDTDIKIYPKGILKGIGEPICRHHTGMKNWNTAAATWQGSEIPKYIEAMKPVLKGIKVNSKVLDEVSEIFLFDPEDFPELSRETAELWLMERLSLSVLVASDRLDAIGVREFPKDSIPELHKKKFDDDNPMDKIRSKYYDDCHWGLFDVVKAPGCYTLTLPTGSGKTNIGFTCAYRIAKKFGLSGIIYSLPFISVVEQCAGFARELFGNDNVQEDHSTVMAEEDRARVLFRYWGAPVVVTTLHMLYGTIFDPKASASINFHKLANSVVILDEPQGMDPHHWSGFHKMLEFLAEKLGTYFIIMTATQPYCENKENEIYRDAEHIKLPVRRGYRFLSGTYGLKSLPEILQKELPEYRTRSGMIVLNTRMSALRAYNILKPELEAYGEVFFLSTLLTPAHRRAVIARIKDKLSRNEVVYLISTQVVETGVDISFDFVVRDFAPLNSIIQAGGRCNRNGLRYGEVVVVSLTDEDGKPFCRMIYDPVSLNKTTEVLKNWDGDPKSLEDGVLEEYNRSLQKGLRESELWANIVKGKWGEFVPLYEDAAEAEVYVETGGIMDILTALNEVDNSLENRYLVKILGRKASAHRIDVKKEWAAEWERAGKIESICLRGEVVYYVPQGETAVYDPISGFQPC